MIRWLLPALLLPAALSAGETVNSGASPAATPLPPPQYPVYENMDYSCTDPQGKRVELGTVICITASCQTWMARCELATTNVIWRKLQDGCPGVSLIGRLTGIAARG